MHGFFIENGKRWLQLAEVEIALLNSLIGQIIQLLDLQEEASSDPLDFLNDLGKSIARPQDEVVYRLLPDAYGEDEEANSEFRRFTERSLRDEKLVQARKVLAGLPKNDKAIEVVELDFEIWLKTLNDVRLALGTRLEITENMRTENLDPEKASLLEVYDWLTWLQGTLLETK